MVEAYQAYGNYEQMADLTQELVQNAAKAVTGGSLVVTLADGFRVRPRRRVGPHGHVRLAVRGRRAGDHPETRCPSWWRSPRPGRRVAHATHGKYVEELWEHFHGDDLHAPTFVMNFPVDTSPLTPRAPHPPRRGREVGPLRPRLRARDGVLRARRPRRAARALRRAGEARRPW